MDIIRTIQETATWIEKVNNDFEVNLFRTSELSPKQYYCEIPNETKSAVVEQIINKRAELLKKANVDLIPVDELYKYGRIMYFDADTTVLDGAPEDASAFFVDIADTPPWDTWLATGGQANASGLLEPVHELNDKLLIGWVPKSQYLYANAAHDVACLGNFEWPDKQFINNEYASIKDLFSCPVIIEPLPDSLFYGKRMATLEIVQRELIENSKKHYEQLIYKHTSKKSFWQKLVMWKR